MPINALHKRRGGFSYIVGKYQRLLVKPAPTISICQLPITNYQLPITYYQLPITTIQPPLNLFNSLIHFWDAVVGGTDLEK
ncbi:MAG TPA: hypothetical protein DCZ55_01075 [Cyanobacteria bacterium UBA11371]|nr:hypothetical protein [Cyanobacteria bacterium UBA11371]